MPSDDPLSGSVEQIGRKFWFTFGRHAMYARYSVYPQRLLVAVIADASDKADAMSESEIVMMKLQPNLQMTARAGPRTTSAVTHI